MSDDRKLLETAARAAGLNVEWRNWVLSEKAMDGYALAFPDTYDYWNPLTDDGDALRLAVKLRLTVDPRDKTVAVFPWRRRTAGYVDGEGYCMEAYGERGQSEEAATRRAITRAAAQIGGYRE